MYDSNEYIKFSNIQDIKLLITFLKAKAKFSKKGAFL